jgi:hypothetical protein
MSVCYVTLTLTPSGLNLCQIGKTVHKTFLFRTLTAVQSTNSKCKIILFLDQVWGELRWGEVWIAEKYFREAATGHARTQKNPRCGGWQISWGRLLLNNLLGLHWQQLPSCKLQLLLYCKLYTLKHHDWNHTWPSLPGYQKKPRDALYLMSLSHLYSNWS